MTHAEALNQLLANSCGTLGDKELQDNGGIQEYYLEGHCKVWRIRAKPLGNFQYEIVGIDDVAPEISPRERNKCST